MYMLQQSATLAKEFKIGRKSEFGEKLVNVCLCSFLILCVQKNGYMYNPRWSIFFFLTLAIVVYGGKTQQNQSSSGIIVKSGLSKIEWSIAIIYNMYINYQWYFYKTKYLNFQRSTKKRIK